MILQVKNADKITIQESEDIYKIIQLISKREQKVDRSKEHFWTIALNLASKIVNIELVGLGSFKSVACEPADVFSIPLQKKASKLILIHNHPSGNLRPSEADINITDQLIQIGRMHNCLVLDHLIINNHSYYSFCDSGLIQKLNDSPKFVPSFLYEKWQKEKIEKNKSQLIKEAEKKGINKGKNEGIKARNKEIARQMLKDGEDLKKIKKYTGLTSQWLGRLKSELEEESK